MVLWSSSTAKDEHNNNNNNRINNNCTTTRVGVSNDLLQFLKREGQATSNAGNDQDLDGGSGKDLIHFETQYKVIGT